MIKIDINRKPSTDRKLQMKHSGVKGIKRERTKKRHWTCYV